MDNCFQGLMPVSHLENISGKILSISNTIAKKTPCRDQQDELQHQEPGHNRNIIKVPEVAGVILLVTIAAGR